MVRHFNETQNSKILLLAVKGTDESALEYLRSLEKALLKIPEVTLQTSFITQALQKHIENNKLAIYPLDTQRLNDINVTQELTSLYEEMTSSFFPVIIDKIDPFSLLHYPEKTPLEIKEGHLLLPGYGFMSSFKLTSTTLEEHTKLYKKIQTIVGEDSDVKVFSSLFYFVENSQAIRSDINKIILLASVILLLLYLFLLRDIPLLINTMATLGTSAIIATIVLTQLYDEVSVFVFIFGISISTIAIDYMFHHYLHGYYTMQKPMNKEVFFGFLTTMSAFFILSFTSFLLIKQISLFAMISLMVSYIHFAFLYPTIGFHLRKMQVLPSFKIQYIRTKPLLVFSIVIILLSFGWIRFDFNLQNLDYNNKRLKATEQFFVKHLNNEIQMTFAIKGETLNALVEHAHLLVQHYPSIRIPLASLATQSIWKQNQALLQLHDALKVNIRDEAERRGFKKHYFNMAYVTGTAPGDYSAAEMKRFGLTVLKMGNSYLAYGQADKKVYTSLFKYNFIKSVSLKERFKDSMKNSIHTMIFLGMLALLIIIVLLYIITKNSIGYALLFLLFPVSIIVLYGLLVPFNILHLFMMFVILSIGIDYAIYLSKENDVVTKQAISYSLISTFAGFGVLVFSSIPALYSMGIIATIGIVSIFILLVFAKRNQNES